MSRIIGTGRRILLLLAVGSLFVLPGLTAQALAQTPSPATAESEPNNRLSQATLIALPAQVQGRIDPVKDVDWYAFSVPQDGEVQISVTGVAANLAIAVQVYNADLALISNWIGPKDKGGDTTFALDLPEAGRYYVLLADDYSDARSLQAYSVAITFTPAVDTGESNNRLQDATKLELDVPSSATVFPTGDVDWYSFSVPRDGEVRISVTGVAANLAINAQVYNANAGLISNWIGPKDKGGDTIFTLDLPAGGRYYLLLADDYSDARSLQAYSVAITFTPAVDTGESNNRLSQATALELGAPRSATVFPTGDVDWYQFEVAGPGKLQVAITNVPAGLALNFQTFNADGRLISNWIGPQEKGGDTVAAVDLPEAGRYYLLLADDYSDARSLQPYTITATFTPGVAP